MKLILENILSHVKNHFPDAQVQAETGQILFPLRINLTQYHVFIKIYDGSNLLQLMTFFPIQYITESESDLALTLHYINGAVDAPGFGMDFNSKTMFYRLMIPALDGDIESEILDLFLKGTFGVLQAYGTRIFSVATGQVTFQDLRKKGMK